MEPSKYIIGIDPGITTCGLAVYAFYEDKKVELSLSSGTTWEIISSINVLVASGAFLEAAHIEDLDSVTNIHESHFPKGANLKTKLGIALRVGKAQAAQLILVQFLESLKLKIVKRVTDTRRRVPEHRKDAGAWLQMLSCPTKTNEEQFAYLLNVWGVTMIGKPHSPYGNGHSRDAATLLHPLFK